MFGTNGNSARKTSFGNAPDEDESEHDTPRHIVKLQLSSRNRIPRTTQTVAYYADGDELSDENSVAHLPRRTSKSKHTEHGTVEVDGSLPASKFEMEDRGSQRMSDSASESEEQYKPRKSTRRAQQISSDASQDEHDSVQPQTRMPRKTIERSSRGRRPGQSISDEDEYIAESGEEDLISDNSLTSEADDLNNFVEDDENLSRPRRPKHSKRSNARSSRRPRPTRRSTRVAVSKSDSDSHSSGSDIQAELEDLRPAREVVKSRELRERTNRPDYAIPPPLTDQIIAASTPPRKRTTINMRSSFRGLYPEYSSLGIGLPSNNQTFGNFGPAKGLHSDSDSSDEEGQTSRTTAKAVAGALLPAMKSMDQSGGGGPSNLGKIKGSNLADADPIGIDKNVSFESVGGLEDHINQLKEMVSLPLLYPEIFERFRIAPPRGVLFHGPPGTGKTLMARALAASCSSEGQKISFYMRKGADCLSKWVGEAERQLRLLFDEAKANQPSIIFFDEIDGLAP